MIKNKLYQSLSILSKRELQEFRMFLLSPYLNQSKTKLELFDYIRSCHPKFTQEKLDYELIFRELKPNETFDKKFVIDRMSDLTKTLEDFLAIQYVKRNPKQKQQLVRANLLDHEQHVLFLQKTEKELERIIKKPRPTWEYYLEVWELKHTLFSHPYNQKFNNSSDICDESNWYLDEAYAIIKLRYGLHYLLEGKIFNTNSKNLPLLDAIRQDFASSENPLIRLYLLTIQIYENDKQLEVFWKNAHTILFENIHLLPLEETIVFITALINRANKIAREKRPAFFGKIFSLYQEGLKIGAWTISGEMETIVFKNIAMTGAFAKEFDWTEQFIKKYQKKLPEKERVYNENHAFAYLEFFRGNYDKADGHLQDLPQRNLVEKLSYKSLMSRCLYERRCLNSKLRESLQDFLDSFYKFIRNQNLGEDTKESYKNLIYFIRLLDKEKDKPKVSRKDNEKLKTKLAKRKRMIAFTWILEKIEAL